MAKFSSERIGCLFVIPRTFRRITTAIMWSTRPFARDLFGGSPLRAIEHQPENYRAIRGTALHLVPVYRVHARFLRLSKHVAKITAARSVWTEVLTSTLLCSSYCLLGKLRRMQRRAKFLYRRFDEKRIVSRRLPRTSRERNVETILVQIDINRVTNTYLATRHQV